jgi:cytidylate kinase
MRAKMGTRKLVANAANASAKGPAVRVKMTRQTRMLAKNVGTARPPHLNPRILAKDPAKRAKMGTRKVVANAANANATGPAVRVKMTRLTRTLAKNVRSVRNLC